MKTLDLNREIKKITGEVMTVADLQRIVYSGAQVTEAQMQTTAKLYVLAEPIIDNQRGSQLTDEQVKTSDAVLKKIAEGTKTDSTISVTDAEFAVVKSAFDNQTISIRAQFIAMTEELNPVAAEEVTAV